MQKEFDLELVRTEDGRRAIWIIDRKTVLKELAALSLGTVLLGIFPESTYAKETLRRAASKRVRVKGMGQKTLREKFKKDPTCRKMRDVMNERGLSYGHGKGGYLTASWSGKTVAIMTVTYESADSYSFLMWLRNGRRIKGCYVINKKDTGAATEAGVSESFEGQDPVIQAVPNPQALQEQIQQHRETSTQASTFECNICQLAVDLIITFGCGTGGALIGAAACGPGAVACFFIVGSVQAAICELMFYPVDREAVCVGLGWC